MNTNLAKRPGSVNFYARIAVPKDLQLRVGKQEVWRSLRTSDRRLAKERLPRVLVQIQEEWRSVVDAPSIVPTIDVEHIPTDLIAPEERDDYLQFFDLMRRAVLAEIGESERLDQTDSGETELTPEVRSWLISQLYEAELQRDADERGQSMSLHQQLALSNQFDLPEDCRLEEAALLLAEEPSASGELLQDRSKEVRLREAKRTLIRRALIANDPSLIEYQLEAVLQTFNIERDRQKPEYARLVNHALRAKLAALEVFDERDNGDFDFVTAEPVVTEFYNDDVHPEVSDAQEAGVTDSKTSLDDLYATYRDDNPSRVSEDSLDQGYKSLWLLSGTLQEPWYPAAMTRDTIRSWKKLLVKYPVRASEQACFRGMSMEEIVQANEDEQKPVVATHTVNKHLSHVSAFCKWMVAEGLLDNNPVSDLFLPKKPKSGRKSFSLQQLKTLYRSPLFAGCASDTALEKPGSHEIRDHRYWLPVLALFTGARLAELAQLLVSDVEQVGDMWLLRITEEGDESKKLKNAASERVVPLHRRIIELDFIEHVGKMKSEGETQVFPELKRNSRGQIAAPFSRRFGKYLENLGLKSDSSLTFHSLRHTFTDQLRLAGFTDDQIGTLLGHSKQTMTARYGQIAEGNLAQRKQMIDALQYEGVQFG